MTLIWATRGRRWGFRFLRDGGFADPLPPYDAAFTGVGDDPSVCHRSETAVAVRFPDPSGRQDSAGRVIPHEFVVFPPLSDQVHTVADALDRVWPLVAEEYARVWASEAN